MPLVTITQVILANSSPSALWPVFTSRVLQVWTFDMWLCWWKIRVSWWQVFHYTADLQPSCLECIESAHYYYGLASGEVGQGRIGGVANIWKGNCTAVLELHPLPFCLALYCTWVCWQNPYRVVETVLHPQMGEDLEDIPHLKKMCCPSGCLSLADKPRHLADFH